MPSTLDIPEINVSIDNSENVVEVVQPAIDILVENGLGPQGPPGTIQTNTGGVISGNLLVTGQLAVQGVTILEGKSKFKIDGGKF